MGYHLATITIPTTLIYHPIMAFSMSVSAKTSSAFLGSKIASKAQKRPTRAKAVRPSAKYGDESVYFDLDDLENTAGSWAMYGDDADAGRRYPDAQNEFFERANEPFSRRESMLSFLAAGGCGSLLVWGGKATRDICGGEKGLKTCQGSLAIMNGPQQTPPLGPRGKL